MNEPMSARIASSTGRLASPSRCRKYATTPPNRIASAARSRVESRKLPKAVVPPVARARAPSTASSREPAVRSAAPASRLPVPTSTEAMTTMPKPMTVTAFAVRCSRTASRTTGASTARPVCLTRSDRSESPRRRSRAREWLADIRQLPVSAARRAGDPGRAADDPRLRLVQLLEGGGAQPADHRATLPPRLDQAGQAQDAQVPADERLREPDVGGEGVDRHRSELGQQADDAQPRLVAEGAVEGPQPAQVAFAARFAMHRHSKGIVYQMLIDISGT